MNRKEVVKILGILKVVYPNSYKDMSDNDLKVLVNIWERQFLDVDYRNVSMAIESIIATDTGGFAPSIGRIKEEIVKLTESPALTEQEAWALVAKAIDGASTSPSSVLFVNGQTDGKTSAQRNFEKLPEDIQRVIGNSKQLADWASMKPDAVSSVVASNFMRSYRARIKSEKEYLALPNNVKKLLQGVSGKEVAGLIE